MGKIRGKFAPFYEELGNDYRWLIELNDFEKFIYQLVLCTIYWNNGSAPDDARYYQRRYNLRARPHQIDRALTAVKQRFRKLIEKDKKLSLLNYKGYENGVARPRPLEVEREIEIEVEAVKKKTAQLPDEAFLKSLRALPAYRGVDIDRELGRMDAWLSTRPQRKKTRRFIVNWLNRCEVPLDVKGGNGGWDKRHPNSQ